jgi:hypothetical protein
MRDAAGYPDQKSYKQTKFTDMIDGQLGNQTSRRAAHAAMTVPFRDSGGSCGEVWSSSDGFRHGAPATALDGACLRMRKSSTMVLVALALSFWAER